MEASQAAGFAARQLLTQIRVSSRCNLWLNETMKIIRFFCRWRSLLPVLLLLFFPDAASAQLVPGVRGLATRAPKNMKIDGDLSEFKDAFCTPVEYFSFDAKTLRNRAAQFFYLWDEEAFYAGLRTLDETPANNAPDKQLWEGDAVEWDFDTRLDEYFRSQAWPINACPCDAHCYWAGPNGTEVQGSLSLWPQ